jgi:hypothetical protein
VTIDKDNLNYRSNKAPVIRRSDGVTLGMVEEPGTNIFIFDKNSWELLRKDNTKLRYRGVVVNNNSYDAVKKKLKRGIMLDWSSIEVVRKLKDRTVMLDFIDSYRVNSEYIGIFKEMGMDKRVRKIESWLKSHAWKFDLIRKIRNVHLIGKSRKKLSKWWIYTEKHVVTVPDCL